MGIAIITKFHGPTNTRGSRYSATAGGRLDGRKDRVYVSGNHAGSFMKRHAAAAKALAEKLGWDDLWIAGGLDGSDIVFVRMSLGYETSKHMASEMPRISENEDWFFV